MKNPTQTLYELNERRAGDAMATLRREMTHLDKSEDPEDAYDAALRRNVLDKGGRS